MGLRVAPGGQVMNVCTTVYVCLGIRFSKYTGARENGFTTGGHLRPLVEEALVAAERTATLGRER